MREIARDKGGDNAALFSIKYAGILENRGENELKYSKTFENIQKFSGNLQK